MVRYNHFKQEKGKKIKFADLKIGDKFRNYLWRGKRRMLILCIKTGEKTYVEFKSKKERSYFDVSNAEVTDEAKFLP